MEVSEKTAVAPAKFSFFDIVGEHTKVDLRNKSKLLHLGIAVVLFVAFYMMDFSFIAPDANKGIALAVTTIWLWITLVIDLFATCLFLAGGSMFLGLSTLAQVRNTFAGSQFLPFIGICAVAVGATNTKLTHRLSYFLLWKIGKSPRMIVMSAMIVTSVISSCVSNIATGVLCGAIFYPVVEAVGDRDKLGRCIMIAIGISSMYGGCALINGSSPNLVYVQNIDTVTEGLYTVPYGSWAACGWPFTIITIAIMMILYPTYFKVPKRDDNIDVEIFHQKLIEVGPITGAEIRWAILLISMVFYLIIGGNIGMVGIWWAFLCVCPGIGILDGKKMLQILPWSLLFIIGFSPIMATFLSPVADYLVQPMLPVLSGLSPFMLMFGIALFRSLCNGILVGSGHSMLLILISLLAPVLITMGYNPATVMLPMGIIASPGVIFGASSNYQTTFQYGYWKMEDTIVPGIVMSILAPLTSTICVYFIGPLVGMNIFI